MYLLSIVLATARWVIAIDGDDRALALAGKAFVAVVPLLLVVAAWRRSTCDRARVPRGPPSRFKAIGISARGPAPSDPARIDTSG
jgi:hypothetical protein